MDKLLLLFLLCVVPMETRTQIPGTSCPTPQLANGRARVRPRTRSVRFSCHALFELVGSRYATCTRGPRGMEWDEPTPICVRPGCKRPTPTPNLISLTSHYDAWLIFVCYPEYKLIGSPSIYCDGHKWNATVPTCVREATGTAKPQQLSCDFEAEDLCGWRQDEMHDFDWRRLNRKTPSSFVYTGPSFDHTLGMKKDGYYMYIESTSQRNNDSARLISPVFDAGLTKNGCFSLYYHMYGSTIGGLRVYQISDSQSMVNLTESEKPELLLFEKWGQQGNFWFRNVSTLREMTTDFQIVIEGIRGTSFTSDIAIDDVAILQGEQCADAAASAVTPTSTSNSCAGRCDLNGSPKIENGCGCTLHCVERSDCCSDIMDMCIFNDAAPRGNATTRDNDDNTSADAPHTEKLVGSTTKPTTTQKTSTTPKPTTVRTTEQMTTRKTAAPTKATTKPTTTRATTKAPTTTTTTVKTTVKTTVPTKPTTRMSFTKRPAVISTTTHVNSRTPRLQRTTATWAKVEASKARKEKEIEAKKVVKAKPESSSPAALIAALALAACLAAAALVALRSARGQAALARLRGRAASDPEVRYLTREDD